MPLEITIAWRYLCAKKKEGFMSVIAFSSFLGIALGVAALIVVMAVMTGFRLELTSKILGLGGHINVTGYEAELIGYQQLAKSIKEIEGVTDAKPVIDGQVMATTKWNTTGALMKGLLPEDLKRTALITDNITMGDIGKFEGRDVVIVGQRLAEKLGTATGDTVTLITPKSTPTAVGMIPRMKEYTVIAAFESGMYEYDASTIYMPLEAAQLLLRLGDSVNAIEVTTNDPDNVMVLTERIISATKALYRVRNWQMDNMSLVNALKVEQTVMFFILTIIVLVAAFNIIAGLVMLVNDKHADIAIMRTMGASKTMVLRIFLWCGSFIGVVGTLLGLLLGVTFAANIAAIQNWLSGMLGVTLFDPVIYFLTELPAVVEFENVLAVSIMALSVSFLATIYPAWKAAKLNPAEVLRYE